MVGCVIADEDGNIVGEGWHRKAGTPHAEVNAIADMKAKQRQGHTAFVTLEPCSHWGRTGPCCEALIKAGIKRVVAAMEDPNPKVAGNGFRRLREAGVEVTNIIQVIWCSIIILRKISIWVRSKVTSRTTTIQTLFLRKIRLRRVVTVL
jgi:riboflavin biosynthesis protein RibD